MNTTWSPYQSAIFDWTETSQTSAVVTARPGSGKTTTSVEAVNRVPNNTKVLFLAYNKRIVTELESRIGSPSVTMRTCNALGHRALSSYLARRLTVNDEKLAGLAKEADLDWAIFGDVLKLAKAAKNVGIVPAGAPGRHASIVPDDDEEWEALADFHDIDFSPRILAEARGLLIRSAAATLSGTIDFADQLYFPVCWNAPFDRYPFIAVDEVQDLSSIQYIMIERSLAKDGRILAVGDPWQSIYAFRGAHLGIMDEIRSKFSAVSLPLSISYRLPRLIAAEANLIRPGIESAPDAPAGELRDLSEWEPTDLPPGAAVLCRNNAPLISLALQLISSGRPATVAGRDIGAGLSRTISKVSPQPVSIPDFLARLSDWQDREAVRKPSRAARLADRCAALRAICSTPGLRTSADAKSLLETLFKEKSNSVLLSTIHKAKGLEWNDVFFLDRHLCRPRRNAQDWVAEQELNLQYVAVTRSKSRLTYINSPED